MNNWVKGALDVLNSTLITEQLETVIKGLEENTEAILIWLKEIKKRRDNDRDYTILDINDYMNKITQEQEEILINHCNYYRIKPEIIAWYEDLDDFYIDWKEHVGYTKEEANKRLNSETGEFCKFPNGEIVRLSI